MLRNHRILLLIILFSIIIIALGVMFYREFTPTIRSFLISDRQAALTERAKTIQEILPRIETKGQYRFVFFEKSLAEQASYIEIRDCFPVPYITQLYIGNPVKFKNTSSQRKTIKILGESFAIPANSGEAIYLNFPSVPMIYEYFCNNSPQPAGYIYVTGYDLQK